MKARYIVPLALAVVALLPRSAPAQLFGPGAVVHDPVSMAAEVAKLKDEVETLRSQLALAKQNLQGYTGGWSRLEDRLADLGQLARPRSQSYAGGIADRQIDGFVNELRDIEAVRSFADASSGNLHAAQASHRMLFELLKQEAERRQLELGRIRDEQADADNFHAYMTRPSQLFGGSQ